MTSLSLVRQTAYHRWRIDYAAVDALSGVKGYRVRYRIGAGAWHTLKSWTTVTHAYLILPKRYAVTFSVRAMDRAGNWGTARHVAWIP